MLWHGASKYHKKLLELLMDSFKFNSKVIALTATFKQN